MYNTMGPFINNVRTNGGRGSPPSHLRTNVWLEDGNVILEGGHACHIKLRLDLITKIYDELEGTKFRMST